MLLADPLRDCVRSFHASMAGFANVARWCWSFSDGGAGICVRFFGLRLVLGPFSRLIWADARGLERTLQGMRQRSSPRWPAHECRRPFGFLRVTACGIRAVFGYEFAKLAQVSLA